MKIVAFYSDKDSKRIDSSPAANGKIEYIASCIKKNGYDIELFSLCVESNEKKIKKENRVTKGEIITHYITAFPRKTFFQKTFHKAFDSLRVFFFLKKNIRKNETILLYHSTRYLRVLTFLHFFYRINFILEVEEVFGDVTSNKKTTKKEYRFFSKAFAYIFPTQLLNEKINKKNMPFLIVHGDYRRPPLFNEHFNDGRIHCVYAGTFDPNKGGAQFFINASNYLDSNYHLHVIGFGNKMDTENIIEKIKDISKTSKCVVSFDGCLIGDNYLRFLQKCQVGVSCQNPDGLFNDTSFPSKIVSYLASDLKVVSIKIPVVKQSYLSNAIVFYDNQNPIELASAIVRSTLIPTVDSRTIIEELDKEFQKGLYNLFVELNLK